MKQEKGGENNNNGSNDATDTTTSTTACATDVTPSDTWRRCSFYAMFFTYNKRSSQTVDNKQVNKDPVRHPQKLGSVL